MRRGLWTALSILTLVSIFAAPVHAQSSETVDFEDHPANPVGTPGTPLDPDFYADQGVRFTTGATVLQYEEGFTSSGSNGLEMCYAAEFCSTPFRVDFDSPQRAVAVSVGYSGTLGETAPVFMVAYDTSGGRVDDDEAMLGPGAPVPIGTQLTVEHPEGRISAVEIRWRDATRAMNSLAMDDLVYEPFIAFVDFDSQPGELQFDSTEQPDEIVVTNLGNVPAVFDVALGGEAEVFELDDTACREDLAPGESCTIGVGFNPPEPGEYAAEVVLISRQLEGPYTIPIFGSLAAVVETPPVTETTPTTEATPTDETTAIDDDAPAEDPATDETGAIDEATDESDTGLQPAPGGGPNLILPLVAAIVLVAVGGGALLVRLWPGSPQRMALPERAFRATATVKVTPDQGWNEIATDDRQPVSAIRVVGDRGRATVTHTEEDQP